MSGPSAYVFNNAEDPNDAGALRKAISGMEIGKPETFGGTPQPREAISSFSSVTNR